MAQHLLTAGQEVIVYDVDSARMAMLHDCGAQVARSVNDIVKRADHVIVMVTGAPQLETVLEEGLEDTLGERHTLIVMSSVGRVALEEVARRIADTGATLVDAPVTGGVARARTAELTILVGAPMADLEQVRPLLEYMGSIAHCGQTVGDGQAVKLVNQLLCSLHLVAAGEALEFARSLGLDPGDVLTTVERGAAASFMLSDRGPRMLSPTEPPVLSAIDIFVKDSSLVLEAAEGSGARVPLTRQAAEVYRQAQESGLGRADDSSVITVFSRDTHDLEESA